LATCGISIVYFLNSPKSTLLVSLPAVTFTGSPIGVLLKLQFVEFSRTLYVPADRLLNLNRPAESVLVRTSLLSRKWSPSLSMKTVRPALAHFAGVLSAVLVLIQVHDAADAALGGRRRRRRCALDGEAVAVDREVIVPVRPRLPWLSSVE
jgi:hypothetical protein